MKVIFFEIFDFYFIFKSVSSEDKNDIMQILYLYC
jgi:hypothetical protein